MKTNVKSAILLGQVELQEKHLKKIKSDFKNPLYKSNVDYKKGLVNYKQGDASTLIMEQNKYANK